LDTAWQVSGTLVGLGIAVVIFVLQVGASQSLRSDTIYRALLRHTGLVWPATMALVFIVGVAIIERFAGHSTAPGWADTWALVLFVAQVGFFGFSFYRAVDCAAPGGVRRVLAGSFRMTIRLSVREALTANVMHSQLDLLCDQQISHGALFSRGKPISAGKDGFLDDVDRQLPGELIRLRLGERMTLTLEPGKAVDVDSPLAKSEHVRGHWLEDLVRRSVVIRRTKRAQSPVDVFEDALDLARRALESGSVSNFRISLRLLLECLAELPASYARWGVGYASEYVEGVFTVSVEREMNNRLANFGDEVFRAGMPEAILEVPGLAAGMVEEGLDQDAPLLVDNGAQLLRRCLERLDLIADAGLGRDLAERVDRLVKQSVDHRQHLLEDVDLPWARRIAVTPSLGDLFVHQIRMMKVALDAEDLERFVHAWRLWVEWARHWNPESDLDDREFEASVGDASDRQQKRELGRARDLVKIKETLVAERAGLMFALGTWALDRRRADNLGERLWTDMLPYLGGAFDIPTLLPFLRGEWDPGQTKMVERWQLNIADPVPGWQPSDVRLVGQFWAVLLLLRAISPEAAAPELDIGRAAAQLTPQIIETIDSIEHDAARWQEAVGDGLSERCTKARSALADAVERERGAERRRLAEAPLSQEKVERFAAEVRKQYGEADFLRRILLLGGAVEVAIDDAACAEEETPLLLPKSGFVDTGSLPVAIWVAEYGRDLALRELAAGYEAALALARDWQGGIGLIGALEAIEEMRRTGSEPEVALVPQGFRGLLHTTSEKLVPEWEWAHSFLGKSDHIAELSGVKVYEAGPPEAASILILDAAKALARHEHRPEDEPSPRVDVRLIDTDRAAALLDDGFRVDAGDSRSAQVTEMHEAYVEIHLEISAEWRRRDPKAPIWRVDLKTKDQGGPDT
jgi:hypothetical protein